MDTVVFARAGAVAEIVFDDGKANVFSAASIARWNAVLDAVLADQGVGAVVLLGRDGFFSGGLDLKTLPALEAGALSDALAGFAALLERLVAFPRPVVAAVGGHALAGGALLALCADVRLAAQGPYRFGINEVALGLAMPRFGVEIARGAIPPASLTEMLLHGRVLTVAEALARGVFESVHEPTALRGAALERADGLARLPSAAYATTKARLRGTAGDVSAADALAQFVDAVRPLAPRAK